jgi:hypothetical protein
VISERRSASLIRAKKPPAFQETSDHERAGGRREKIKRKEYKEQCMNYGYIEIKVKEKKPINEIKETSSIPRDK